MTPAQRKANARNQLFRQLHGSSIKRFIDAAIREQAISGYEYDYLKKLERIRTNIISQQFEGAKAIGLHPKRRCKWCGKVAHWKVDFDGDIYNICNKCKKLADMEIEANIGRHNIVIIKKINPNE